MRDDIRRTDYAIQVRMLLEEIHHAFVTALRVEIRDLSGNAVRIQTRVPYRLLHALPSGKSGRLIFLENADVDKLPSALAQKQSCQFTHAIEVIVVHAGQLVYALSCDHKRHRTAGQR